MGDMTAAGGGNVRGEQEWRVVREQQQKQPQANRYGSANSIVNYPSEDATGKLQQKEAEITHLYTLQKVAYWVEFAHWRITIRFIQC